MFFVVEVYYWSAFFSYFRMSNLGKGTLLQSLYKTVLYLFIIMLVLFIVTQHWIM